MKEDYQKALEKLTSFSFKPSHVLMDKLSKTKGVQNDWPVALQVTKQVQKYFLVHYILSDQVWWCNVKQFWLIPKIMSANLCKSIDDIVNYSTSICPAESGNCGKEGTKLQKS